MSRLELNLWWEARDPSQSEDAQRFSRFVTGLPSFDPIYQSWLDSPETRKETVRIPLSESEAKQLLIDKMARSDFTDELSPEHGSHIWGGHAGPPPYDFRASSYADTRCNIGGFGVAGPYQNHIFMRLSKLRPITRRPWRASELRSLMKFTREVWNPLEMCAKFSFYDAPRIPDRTWAAGERFLRPVIGWITYLPANLAARGKYPSDVEVETLEDGAVLVTLCEEPFDKGDVESLARLHTLEAALRPIQS